MSIRAVLHPTMPISIGHGVHQIDLRSSLNALASLHVMGFYEDAAFYGIKMWIDAFMTLENSPMPSGVWFATPLHEDPVPFPELCLHLETEWVMMEREYDESEPDFDWDDETSVTMDIFDDSTVGSNEIDV